VSSAALLDVQEANDKSGKPYYKYEILTRTGARVCGHELSRNKHFNISYMRCSSTRLRVARAANIFLPSATALHTRLPLQLCKYCLSSLSPRPGPVADVLHPRLVPAGAPRPCRAALLHNLKLVCSDAHGKSSYLHTPHSRR